MNFIKFFPISMLVLSFTIVSCNKDDSSTDNTCQTCKTTVDDITISTEYCQDGDDVIQTLSGTTITIENTTVEAVVANQELIGATCD